MNIKKKSRIRDYAKNRLWQCEFSNFVRWYDKCCYDTLYEISDDVADITLITKVKRHTNDCGWYPYLQTYDENFSRINRGAIMEAAGRLIWISHSSTKTSEGFRKLSDFDTDIEVYYDGEDYKERRIMNMKDYVKIPSGVKEIAKQYATNYATENIKNHFGVEVYIKKYDITKNDSNNDLTNYLRSIIKNFDKRVLDINNNCRDDILLFEKIDKGTFIIMISGIYNNRAFKEKLMFDHDVSNDTIYTYVFGRKSPRYSKLITKQIKKAEIDSKSQSIYVVSELNSRDSNVQHLPLQQRDIGTMYYSNDEIDKVTKFIDKYESSEKYYNELELSYKTGILLYGNPGTGKSSLVKTIAHKYNREICQVDVTNISNIDLSMLTNLINNDTSCKYIVLFEDIDTMMLDRQEFDQNNETVKQYKDNINRLLQFLDSSSSPNNVIFIATTNYYDKLDKALIREGRFDLKLEVAELEEKDLQKYMDHLQYTGSVDSVVNAYGDNDGKFNQSKLQNVIVNLRESI